MKVIRLERADAEEIAAILRPIVLDIRLMGDPRSNSLIYSGPAEDFDALLQVVQQLDGTPRDSRSMTLEMIPVQHRSAEEVAERIASMVGTLARSHDLRVAADLARSMVIVGGTEAALKAARQIAKQLDEPAQPVELEFAFFGADQNEPDAEGEMPSDLADVARELSRFGGVRLLARLATVATAGDSFGVNGSIGRQLSTKVEGAILRVSPNGSIRFNIDATMTAVPESTDGKQGRADTAKFRLETTIVAERGQTVVIGTAPMGAKPGESAILVVMVHK
ncbi:MAG: secretin N-terminal domain-containing protein [Phycisphaerae bacterium]